MKGKRILKLNVTKEYDLALEYHKKGCELHCIIMASKDKRVTKKKHSNTTSHYKI